VFPDAEGVARSLRGQLQPDDAVVTLLPASLPQLQYYFLARDYRPTYWCATPALPPTSLWFRGRASAEHYRLESAATLQHFATADLVELERS